ncbi:SRPBCC domain-containing protein [Puia sp. P3]|uniref:SRPBCC domain-containing protein n=1 Tax=Puia sp. P3 TaxID=3423952 RepID=UPI003D675FEF
MELREGGMVRLDFLHRDLSPVAGPPPEKYKEMEAGKGFTGRVLRVEAPRLLSFTWEGDSEVTFELEGQGDKVLLTLTHRKLAMDIGTLTGVSAGWHTHLENLMDRLKGVAPANFWKRFCQLEELYSAVYDPTGSTGMLIRRPVAEVFGAFVDPAVTTKFWFTKSTGRLEAGKEVVWTWGDVWGEFGCAGEGAGDRLGDRDRLGCGGW